MKIRYILGILTVLFLSSCEEDYLQRDPGVDQTKKDVFNSPEFASRFADRSYFFTVFDYGRLNASGQPYKGTTAEFTDEAVSGNAETAIRTMNSGNWLDQLNATDVTSTVSSSRAIPPYVKSFRGIRNVNVVFEQIDNVPWKTDPRFNKRLIKAQQHYLRAHYYFELAKRYGGMPIYEKPIYLDATGNNPDLDQPRATFEDTMKFIESDLDSAEAIFTAKEFVVGPDGTTGGFRVPDVGLVYSTQYGWNPDYKVVRSDPNDANKFELFGDISPSNGRVDVGVVRALRSRAQLFAASPLHNTANDLGKWEKAADAAKEVIDMQRYALHPDYGDILEVPSSPEYIWINVKGARNSVAGTFYMQYVASRGSGGDLAALNPTQNHVDLYEMTNGKRINDSGSGYTLANPYSNRDPRLNFNVLVNNRSWQGRKIETWYQSSGGEITYGNDAGAGNFTVTGYYSRKMWPEAIKAGNATALHNYVYFRYGEVLLNYAEALNEAKGPVQGVIDALNQIRKRPTVNMPTVEQTFVARGMAITKETMRDFIHHERAVELAFEDVRWWDILRWKKGEELVAQPMRGMEVKKTGTNTFEYTPFVLGDAYQKVFKPYMHLYPIPWLEIARSAGNLKQNPGWSL